MTSDTIDGTKNLGNRNALLHGLYAKDVLLPWDSKEDFLKLHEDLKAVFALAETYDLALTAKRGAEGSVHRGYHPN
jgi:hypothetical protein